MIISVINHTKLSDKTVLNAIRAINRQIAEDFQPSWGMEGILRLEGKIKENPDLRNMAASMRGDAILYLEDKFSPRDPFGFHDRNFRGIPFGFVYTDLAKKLGEPWSVTLSHEALELIADPEVNLLVMGPHPEDPSRDVFHWYEVCDAVQSEHYKIDGVAVSNFVLPLYFTGGDEVGGRNDFLGTKHRGKTLQSFGINPGGYVGYYDPELGNHDQSFANREARKRSNIKKKLGFARRSVRYQNRREVLTALSTKSKRKK